MNRLDRKRNKKTSRRKRKRFFERQSGVHWLCYVL